MNQRLKELREKTKPCETCGWGSHLAPPWITSDEVDWLIELCSKQEEVLIDISEAESPFGPKPGTEKEFLKQLHLKAREALEE